ncbi:MAG: vacuolar iron transporter family protein [Actinomycetota bacterium]|jgi:VIT1/CCC1 family predicted Fe2+/Mn2+ transporter|nr:vacuolar iron transporter family protein [Actinomycetota bacterium]
MSVAPAPEHHHRDVTGGAARAAVFGISDGLVTNVGLILGVAGANASASVVRLAGLALLIAGAVSMASGEFNSMKVQTELFERELEMERRELARNPHVETVELALIYQSKGMSPDQARQMSEAMMSDPERALEAHAREELGIDPKGLGSPMQAAVSSFLTFSAGAMIPLIPWFFGGGTAAKIASLALALATSAIVGAIIGQFTERKRVVTILRQIAFTAIPAVITYAIGSAVGVSAA